MKSSTTLSRHWLAFNLRRQRLTYLDHRALSDLHKTVVLIEKQNVQGVIVEAGCALGGSAIMMASAKERKRNLHIFDVFGMIPPPSKRDGKDVIERYEIIKSGKSKGISGDEYYGYRKNLKQEVERNFMRYRFNLTDHSIELIEGLFEDTLPQRKEEVALAHIDGDWYGSVKCCLAEIAPRLSVQGRIVVDDYDAWSGCRTAVDEFLASNDGQFLVEERARLHLIRIR